MRQIPQSGEWCVDCPCYEDLEGFCNRYVLRVTWDDGHQSGMRLPQCKEQKPQVLTEEDRQILDFKGFQKGIAEAAANIYTPKEDVENEL